MDFVPLENMSSSPSPKGFSFRAESTMDDSTIKKIATAISSYFSHISKIPSSILASVRSIDVKKSVSNYVSYIFINRSPLFTECFIAPESNTNSTMSKRLEQCLNVLEHIDSTTQLVLNKEGHIVVKRKHPIFSIPLFQGLQGRDKGSCNAIQGLFEEITSLTDKAKEEIASELNNEEKDILLNQLHKLCSATDLLFKQSWVIATLNHHNAIKPLVEQVQSLQPATLAIIFSCIDTQFETAQKSFQQDQSSITDTQWQQLAALFKIKLQSRVKTQAITNHHTEEKSEYIGRAQNIIDEDSEIRKLFEGKEVKDIVDTFWPIISKYIDKSLFDCLSMPLISCQIDGLEIQEQVRLILGIPPGKILGNDELLPLGIFIAAVANGTYVHEDFSEESANYRFYSNIIDSLQKDFQSNEEQFTLTQNMAILTTVKVILQP